MDKNEKTLKHRICIRMIICMGIFALIGAGIVRNLFREQVINHELRVAEAQEQTQVERNLQSPRGMILDRNGKVLAISEMSKSLYADPTMLNEDPAVVADLLAPYLRIPKDVIEHRLKEDTAFVWLDRQMDHEKYEAVESIIKEEKLHGLAFRDENRRFYPNGSMAAQVIGFVGENDHGLEGIEMMLDDEIRGSKQTFRLQTDNHNIPVFSSALKRILPDKERSVCLTLDSTIQYVAEKGLDGIMSRSHPFGASIIVMDPKTGEILAMASRPTYDPNDYSKGNKEAYKNRAVVNVYEPGSTFKPLMAAAALDSGKWHLGDIYHDKGSIHVADRTIYNWDHKGMGDVTLREIIMYSINTGMVHVAVTTGGKTLTNYARRFGFGTITGIELSGEQEGILFDPDKMSIVDTATMGIGQSIAVTPLQMVQAFSAIANGGHMMKPFLVKEIDNPDGSIYKKTEPKEVGQPINAGTAEAISKFMGEEVSIGGGQSAKSKVIALAARPGRLRRRPKTVRGTPTASMSAPLSVSVLWKTLGSWSSSSSTTLRASIMELRSQRRFLEGMMTEIVRMKGIRPTEEMNQKPVGPVVTTPARTIPPVHISSDGVLMPSFIGWSTREVNDWLNEAGLGFIPKGMGKAIQQSPKAGSYAPQGSDVTVIFKRNP